MRLWPLSRESYPKQFLALTGGQTMLQQTATRLRGLPQALPQVAAPLLVCSEEHRFLAASQLMEIGFSQATILLEPVARNTAPALTIAALHALEQGADPIMLVMPSDHVIADLPAFHQAVQKAYEVASQGRIVTFGVVADHPETGYGYIRCDAAGGDGMRAVEGFTEKPDAERARQYLKAGNYLWNSGLFMLRASVWLDAMRQCKPEILGPCQAAMQAARHDLDFIRPDVALFTSSPSDSIDYAVMEKLPAHQELGISLCVVPLQADWSDVGTWDALWKVSERDSQGNALMGEAVVQHDCNNSLLLANSRLVAGIGLDDLIVVETPDAVLVAQRNRTQDVKKVVARLSSHDHASVRMHRKVHRPWGWYDCIDKGERFQVKRIVVNPGANLSLQMHRYRAEHWIVVKGIAQVTHENHSFLLRENESTYIPVGHRHRLSNPGEVPLEVIEIQSGSYLGEDDIVRFDDTYGRVA